MQAGIDNSRISQVTKNVAGAVEDLKNGKIVILVDNDSRENEGDMVLASEKATEESLNFILKNAGGLMCVACDGVILDRLEIHPMVENSTDKLGTPFTVSVDAAYGTTTGMSVSDRIKTIRTIVDPKSIPSDLARPGHLFPLRANDKGLSGRQGHTEGSVALMKIAGLIPSAVICEVMTDKGTMARRDYLEELARKNNLRIVSNEELIEFERLNYIENNYTVVILSAGRVPESILPLSSHLTHAMVPVNGKPAIYWSMKNLISLGFKKFVIVIGQGSLSLNQFVMATFGKKVDIEFVISDRDLGPGYSLSLTKDFIKTPQMLLVLGDTLFEFDEASKLRLYTSDSFVLYKNEEGAARWSWIETDNKGIVGKFTEKGVDMQGFVKALIGVYKLSEPRLLYKALSVVLRMATNSKIEISHGLERYMHLDPLYAYEAKKWFDVGHIDNLLDTRRKMLPTRAYNQISVNEFMGTVTKRSADSKFVDEVDYYQKLPSKLRSFFPNVFDTRKIKGGVELEMEYYGHPTLGELFVFGKLDEAIWRRVLTKLFNIIEYFSTFDGKDLSKEDFDKIYIDKTEREYEALKKQDEEFGEILSQKQININGVDYSNFEVVWKSILPLVKKMYKPCMSVVIHGDMCFNNILYDVDSGVIKLVDPRGSFGEKGIYGDNRYDVAKLYHSVHGGYEFIVNDLYNLVVKDNEYEFDLMRTESSNLIMPMFESIFFVKFDKKEILLIEGLMYISMCARHYEDKQRQKAFYITGIKILNEVLGKNDIQIKESIRENVGSRRMVKVLSV